MNIKSEPGLTFDDVLLVPQEGKIASRNGVILKTNLTKNFDIDIPITCAPMTSVASVRVLKELHRLGGMGFIHRFQSTEDQISQFHATQAGCAIGINDVDRFIRLFYAGCKLFILDVAHAHTREVFRFLNLPNFVEIWDKADIIVGSVATPEAIEFFYPFPVAAFRVGVGPGAACTTRTKTGFGVPQLTAISECAEAAGDIPVIADGGIRNSSDIVKALAAGASSVMLGSLIAQSLEAPNPGKYWGMASEKAKKENGCNSSYIEGESGSVGIKGTLESIVDELIQGVKSGISYGGGHTISDLQRYHEFIVVNQTVLQENSTRLSNKGGMLDALS